MCRGGARFSADQGRQGSQTPTRFVTPLDERRAVVNVSFGAEYALNETYAAYLGFWTDFSPLTSQQFSDIDRSGQGFVLATGEVDLYHVVFGATRTTKRSTIAAGVVVSQGDGDRPVQCRYHRHGRRAGFHTGGPPDRTPRIVLQHLSFTRLYLLLFLERVHHIAGIAQSACYHPQRGQAGSLALAVTGGALERQRLGVGRAGSQVVTPVIGDHTNPA